MVDMIPIHIIFIAAIHMLSRLKVMKKKAPQVSINLPDLVEIRILRTRLGWTQRRLAQATGLSQSFINKIETNEADPGFKTAKTIFHALSVALSKSDDEVKTARDIMSRHVEYVSSGHTLEVARKIMIKNDYSQLPVIDNGLVKGCITDRLLMSLADSDSHRKVSDFMGKKLPVVDPDTKLETIRLLLDEYPAVLVDKGAKEHGIVTKHDVIKSMK